MECAAGLAGRKLANADQPVFRVRACREEDQKGRGASQRPQVFSQFDGRLIGPVPVFQDEHNRLALSQLFEQLAHAKKDLPPQAGSVEVAHAVKVLWRDTRRQYRGDVRQHFWRTFSEERRQALVQFAPHVDFGVVVFDFEAGLENFDEGQIAQAAAK